MPNFDTNIQEGLIKKDTLSFGVHNLLRDNNGKFSPFEMGI
jgi:hypothetical protein